MRYRVVCVGRKARDPLLEAADDYLGRLSRYVPTELLRLREGSIDSERKELLKVLGKGGRVVALDERGKEATTTELARRLESYAHSGESQVTFVIGGADGLHPDVLALAHERWALSRFTLPHRMALALLAEQLYRAHTLLRGEPYHRA